MRYYPLAILLICLIVSTIWMQGVILLLLISLLIITNWRKPFTRRKWQGVGAILGFILLGTLPLLITRISSTHGVLLSLGAHWGVTGSSFQLFSQIFLRCLNGYLCLLLFTSIIPIYQLLIEMRATRLPKVVTQLIEMIYRFINILFEKAEQVLIAQKSRLGYFSFSNRLSHSSMLLSRTLILAVQDSDVLYDSMLARGLDEGESSSGGGAIEIPTSSHLTFGVSELSFRYKGHEGYVLKDLNLNIQAGEKVALLGANGAGKSTLMRILAGLELPDAGAFSLSGEDQPFTKSAMKLLRQKVGIIFQSADLQLFSPTVWEEIAFGLRNLGYSGEELEQAVEQTLQRFELQEVAKCPPHCLSGGQKKWVTLAAVEAMSPEIILLDEPFTGLDGLFSEKLVALLNRWHQEGKTLLIATHNSEFARSWSSRMLLLSNGTIEVDASPQSFFTHSDRLLNAHITIPSDYLTQEGASTQRFLPLFMPASKLRAVVIGGGKGAYRKVLSLLQREVMTDIISSELDPTLQQLIEENALMLRHIPRDYLAGDLKHYSLAFLATGDLELEQRMIEECEEHRVHYNCISKPAWSTFQFGAMGEESGIEFAVHTQYQLPHLGQRLRDRVMTDVIAPIPQSKLENLAHAREQMNRAKRVGSRDYEGLKNEYERLLDEL